MKTHQITSHDMTWHLATNHITSPHVTSQPTALLHRSLQPTTSKQVTTSPPWNGWRLVHSNNSVWASQSLVTLCTFYRQILSLTYRFSSWKLPPPACPALLVHIMIIIYYHIPSLKLTVRTWKWMVGILDGWLEYDRFLLGPGQLSGAKQVNLERFVFAALMLLPFCHARAMGVKVGNGAMGKLGVVAGDLRI